VSLLSRHINEHSKGSTCNFVPSIWLKTKLHRLKALPIALNTDCARHPLLDSIWR
jgi:hypothetical protein